MSVKQKIITYYQETMVELKKVSWPTKEEVKGSTVVVIVTSIILSAFIFIVDRGLASVVNLLFG